MDSWPSPREQEPYSLSLAKKAVAFFNMSRSICAMLWPPVRTSLTASALNSAANCRLFLVAMFTSRRIIAPSQVSTKAGEPQDLCAHLK